MAESSPVIPLGPRLFRFVLGLFLLWLIVFQLAPIPLQHFSPLREFAQEASRLNLHPGAVYYTDVPLTPEAEARTRAAVADGMRERRTAASSR